VTARRFPFLRIQFAIGRYRGEAEALVDTGCDVALVIPHGLIPDLPPPGHTGHASTVSGERLTVPAWRALIELVEQPGAFEATALAAGDEFILGLPALNRFRVTFDHGERLIVEP
jgi:predicted aspartyl protease